jgi:hypothetical protein
VTGVAHNNNFVLSESAQQERLSGAQTSGKDSTAVTLYGKLTKPQCKAKYDDRHFLPVDQKKFPPMLYTFPGSGNTWCRLLIEYATGIYTGSVYNDKSLLHSLPGEFTCNSQVSAIKIHPHTHPFEGLRTGNFHSDATKCKRGGIDRIRRAILLVRDPFDSIWSEYQRRITQSHVGGVLKANFDWPRWQANAAALSHQYHLMWAVHHAGIEKHFAPKDILYLKYEDLKNRATRVATLQRVADFLGISTPTEERLECAFALADNRETHRKVDASLTMTKEEAYTAPLACRMWALFGAHAAKHGYKMWRDMDCSQLAAGTSAGAIKQGEGGALVAVPAGASGSGNAYPPIPRVNVGGQGEYDRKWVQPGQPLLDFGGHPTAQPAGVPPGAQGTRGPAGGGSGRRNGPNGRKGGGPGMVGGLPPNQQQQIQRVPPGPGVGTGQLHKQQPPRQDDAQGTERLDKTNQWMRYEQAPLPLGANAAAGPAAQQAAGGGKGLSASEVASAIMAKQTRAAGSAGALRSQAGQPAAGGVAQDPSAAAQSALLQQLTQLAGSGAPPLNEGPTGAGRGRGKAGGGGAGAGKLRKGRGAARGTWVEDTGKRGAQAKVGGGLTLEQASQDGAVLATVGADKPAWQ